MIKVDWILFAVLFSAVGVLLIFYSKRKSGKVEKSRPLKKDFNDEGLREAFNKIVDLVNTEKYFLNKNLKVSHLADELGENDRVISKAINKYGNGNFNKFINSFRVEYSKDILIGGKFDHYTIEAIAEESGFSNKVSFYNAFKSETGMSPTQFRAIKQSKSQ